MGFVVEDIRFLNKGLGEFSPTNWLADYVGDVVYVQIDVRQEEYVQATSTTPNSGDTVLVTHPAGDLINGIIRDERHLWTDNVVGFQKFDEGDEVTVDMVGFPTEIKTILEKVNSQLLLMDTDFVNKDVLGIESTAYVSTSLESVELSHGLIENNEPTNYVDKTDGNTRRAQVQGLSNTVLTETIMEQLGAKSNQFGTLSVRGNGTGDGSTPPAVSQAFTISQKLLIEPLSLASEIDNDRVGIAPSYLKDANSLKYVFRVAASKDLNNPNNKKIVVEGEILGNVGYENELYNGGETKYSVSNVTYERADLTTIDALELTTDEITVTFDLDNTEDTPYVDGATKIIVEHRYLPTPEELYREPEFPDTTTPNEARNRVLKENFFFDRIVCTVGSTSTLSDNNGGVDQIIKDCTPTFISSNKIRVVTTIKMSSTAVSRIAPQDEYKLLVSTKNVALTRAKSDKTKIRVDFNRYFSEQQDPNMIQITNTFLDLTNEDVDAGSESLTVRTEDAVLGVASFTLDRNDIPNFNRSDAAINILSATGQMIAKNNTTGDFFVLDTYSTDFFELEIIDDPTYGTVPFIDITEDRGFTTPADDLRKNVRVKRRKDLDSGGVFAYEFRYPFIVRWEPWEPLNTVNNEFLDPTQQNNGKNHDWMHYFIGTDWNLYMRIEIVATKDGLPLAPYTLDSVLLTEDYDDGLEWDTPVTTTQLTSNLDPIINGGGQYGVSFVENTLVESDMNYVAFGPPTLPDLEFVMMINVFEKTNYLGQFRIYTQYDTDLSNQWIGLAGILKATKTDEGGNKFRVSAELKPPAPEQTFKFSWRIYDKRPDSGVPNGKTLAQGGLKTDGLGFVKDIV